MKKLTLSFLILISLNCFGQKKDTVINKQTLDTLVFIYPLRVREENGNYIIYMAKPKKHKKTKAIWH